MAVQLLTAQQVADLLGIKVKTWHNWRSVGRFDDLPQTIYLGNCNPRWRATDVEAFIQRHATNWA